MAVLVVLVASFICVEISVLADTTPVSVHYGEDATFSWPLPASAWDKVVTVVSPGGQSVLTWAPDCRVIPSVDFADRVRTSCQDQSKVTFTLLGAVWPDEGPYTCRDATSSGPRIEDCGQTLTVVKDRPFPQPQITYSGVPVLGQPYSMSCECVHHCPLPAHILRCQWLRNSQVLPDTAFVFSVARVSQDNLGTYTCRIIGSSPETASPASPPYTWVPMVPPQVHVEVHTSDAVVKETIANNLTLTCVVTKAYPKVPADGYSWSYLPSPQGQLRPLVGKTSTLTLGHLTQEVSGQYFCQARNDQMFGSTYIPPGNASLTLSTSCIDVLLGSASPRRAVLEKSGDGYKAVIEVPWHDRLIAIQHPNSSVIINWHPPCSFSVTDAFKDRVTNMSCDPCTRALSFSLVNVTKRDLGWYQCYAGTIHGEKLDSCSVELISKVPIQVHMEPVTPDNVVKVTEGSHLTLTCVVTQAFPPVPEDGYSWSYLPSSQGQLRSLVGKTSTLTLNPLTRDDSGQYFCQARNDQDARTAIPPGNTSIAVDVSYLGRITPTSDLEVKKGDHVTLTCSVDSKPAARLAWVVEGREVGHVTGNVVHYVIPGAACSDSKIYTCRASNPDLPGLERNSSTTLTVSCGQVDVCSENKAWQTVAITLMALIFVQGVFMILLWHKRLIRKRPSGEEFAGLRILSIQDVSSESRTGAHAGEEVSRLSTGSSSSDIPLLTYATDNQ